MDLKLFGVSVFVAAAAVSFFVSSALATPGTYSRQTDFRIGAGDGVKTFSFERNITFMVSDTGNASFFVDPDGDGSPERELSILRDGEVHELRELVSSGDRTYMLYIRYHDGPETGDAWLEVYRVRRV